MKKKIKQRDPKNLWNTLSYKSGCYYIEISWKLKNPTIREKIIPVRFWNVNKVKQKIGNIKVFVDNECFVLNTEFLRLNKENWGLNSHEQSMSLIDFLALTIDEYTKVDTRVKQPTFR